MVTSDILNSVQQLYIAYYGRPADPGGHQYWANIVAKNGGNIGSIITNFSNTPEAVSLYGTSQTPAQRVEVLYKNILGRAPEQAGLDYWVNQVNSGNVSLDNLTISILKGAQNSDAALVTNKLAVANVFTSQVTDGTYVGNAAAAVARTLLTNVTSDPVSVQTSYTSMPAYVNTTVVATQSPSTFTNLISSTGTITNPAVISTATTTTTLPTTTTTTTTTTTAGGGGGGGGGTTTTTDTTAPSIKTASVAADGRSITLSYDESITGTLETGDFTVALASGTTTVTAATLGTGANASQITLHLSNTILSTSTVNNVTYTATNGTPNSVKDLAATPNNAATQTFTSVTNSSTATTDTTAPTMSSAAVSADGRSIVVTYSEPVTGTLEAGDWGVTLSAGSTTFNSATIGTGADANKVTLGVLKTIPTGTTVSNLVYTAAAGGAANSLKDAALTPNNAADQTLAAVTNSSTVAAETTAPTMTSATVNAAGTSVVITCSEPLTGTLEAGDFTINVAGGGAVAATAATLGTGADANKITLTPNSTIGAGQTVVIAYSKAAGAGSSVKDAAQALTAMEDGSVTNANVTNSSTVDLTKPTMSSAAVSADGSSIVVTYSEAMTGSAFDAGDFVVTLNSGSTTINSMTVGTGSDTNKVTLGLSHKITSDLTVSNLEYKAANGAQTMKDTAAIPNTQASATLGPVTNSSTVAADAAVPTITSAAVATDGRSIVLTCSEAVTGAVEAADWAVNLSAGTTTVSSGSIGTGANANKITLNLTNTISSSHTVNSIVYTNGNVTNNSILDGVAAQNIMATQTLNSSITNSSTVTGDLTPPSISSATVQANGTDIVLAYSEVVTGTLEAGDFTFTINGGGANTATGATLGTGADANKITITKAGTTISAGDTVTVTYTATNSTPNSVKDAAPTPNSAATQSAIAATNNSAVDTTAPTMASAAVSTDGRSIVVTYSEKVAGMQEAVDWAITLSGGTTAVSSATVGTAPNDNKITLNLTNTIPTGVTVSSIAYTAANGTGNSVKDQATTPNNAGNQTLNTNITNSSTVAADFTAPSMSSAAVATNGNSIVLTYNEIIKGTLEASDWAVTLGAGSTSVIAAVQGTGADANKVTLHLGNTIAQSATITNVVYTATNGTANSVTDASVIPNNAATQTLTGITNSSTNAGTAPTVTAGPTYVDGTNFSMTTSSNGAAAQLVSLTTGVALGAATSLNQGLATSVTVAAQAAITSLGIVVADDTSTARTTSATTVTLGTTGGDTITGTTGANVIYGFGGTDRITGGTGADIIDVGADTDADVVVFTALTDGGAAGVNGGGDTVKSYVAANDSIDIDGAFQTAVDDIGAANATFVWGDSAGSGPADVAVNLTTTVEALWVRGADNSLSAADLQNLTTVATAINAAFAITSVNTDDAVVWVNSNAAGSEAALYYYLEAGTAEVQAGELRLIGVFSAAAGGHNNTEVTMTA